MLSTTTLYRDFALGKRETTENKQASHQQNTEEKPVNISAQFKKLVNNITNYRLKEHFGEDKKDEIKEKTSEASPYIADYLAEEIITFQMIIDAAIELHQKTGATSYLAYPMKSHIGKHVFAFMESINKDKLKQYKDAFKFIDTTDVMRSNQPDASVKTNEMKEVKLTSSSSTEEVSAEDADFNPIKLTEVKAKENDVLFVVISDQNPLFNSKSLLAVLNSAKKDANFLSVNVMPTGTLQAHSIALKNKLLKKEKNALEVYKEAYKKEKQNESRARIACYEAGYQCVATPGANESKEISFKSIKHHNVENLINKLKNRLVIGGWQKEADTLKLQLDSNGIVSLPELPKDALNDLEVKTNLQLLKALNQSCLQKGNTKILPLTIDNLFTRKEPNQAFIIPWRELVALPEYKQKRTHVLKSLNHQYKIKQDDLNKMKEIEEQLNDLRDENDYYYEDLWRELISEDQCDFACSVQINEKGITTFNTNLISNATKPIKSELIDRINRCNGQINKLLKEQEYYIALAAREHCVVSLESNKKIDNVNSEFKVIEGGLPTGGAKKTSQGNDVCLTLPQGSLFMSTNENPLMQGSMFKRSQKKQGIFVLGNYRTCSRPLQRKKN